MTCVLVKTERNVAVYFGLMGLKHHVLVVPERLICLNSIPFAVEEFTFYFLAEQVVLPNKDYKFAYAQAGISAQFIKVSSSRFFKV